MEVYQGGAPDAHVPGTPWRTWWKIFSSFLTLTEVGDKNEQRLIFLQEIGSNYKLLGTLLQGKSRATVARKGSI